MGCYKILWPATGSDGFNRVWSPGSALRMGPAKKKTHYTMKEACELIGVSRHTLLRWFAEGRVDEVPRSRRNNYRMFRDEDIERIREYAEAVDLPSTDHKKQGRLFED